MKTKNTWLILFSILSLVFSAAVYAKDATSYSGFLKHYPNLKPDPKFKGAHKWKNPKVDMGKYNKGMIAPLEVWLSPDSKIKGFSADQIKVLDETYRAIITDVLEPDFPLVSKPGKGVLLLRLALTNVKVKEREKNVSSWTPVGLLLRGVDAAGNAGINHLDLQQAVFEGQVVDSMTGEVVGVRMATGVGLGGKEMHWEGLKDFIRNSAEQFGDDL